MKAISIKDSIGLGDKVQFSSVPENYFRATGEKLIDIGKCWIFDYNPYVIRDYALDWNQTMVKYSLKESDVVEMWDYVFNPQPLPPNRDRVYVSLAERHAWRFGVPCVMKYPRLYRFEEFPFEKRTKIIFHPHGKSNGSLPEHVIEHVKKKYGHMDLWQIGLESEPDHGIPKLITDNFWDLASVISEAKMYIGIDSGPSWLASCYPDVVVKKVRMFPTVERLRDWIPLEICNYHAHWDCRIFSVHNPSEDDVGFTSSYRRL